jgi:hypothetical protein
MLPARRCLETADRAQGCNGLNQTLHRLRQPQPPNNVFSMRLTSITPCVSAKKISYDFVLLGKEVNPDLGKR